MSGVTGIDSPAGPSELLVIANDSANSVSVAREVLAQAEHDPRAAVIVIARSDHAAHEIGREIEAFLANEPRRIIIAEALATRGALLWTESLERAIAFSNEYAPEHLLLALRDPGGAFERFGPKDDPTRRKRLRVSEYGAARSREGLRFRDPISCAA